jgi:hypothetical protein
MLYTVHRNTVEISTPKKMKEGTSTLIQRASDSPASSTHTHQLPPPHDSRVLSKKSRVTARLRLTLALRCAPDCIEPSSAAIRHRRRQRALWRRLPATGFSAQGEAAVAVSGLVVGGPMAAPGQEAWGARVWPRRSAFCTRARGPLGWHSLAMALAAHRASASCRLHR